MPAFEISTPPALLISTDDLTVASRIRELDKNIHASPEAFLESCHRLGGIAVEHMTNDPVAHESEPTTKQLKEFLDNNDLAHAEFDPESDDAIYSHAGVMDLIKATRSAKGQRVKQGGKYVPRENTQAVENRNNASVLKLYLYAGRVQQWESRLNTSTDNGAA